MSIEEIRRLTLVPHEDEDALTHGRWVRDGLIMRWQYDDDRPRNDTVPLADLIACPKCRATVTESCRTKGGHRSNADHVERLAPKLCVCGHPPKPKSHLCERCSRESAAASKRDSYERAKRRANQHAEEVA